MTRDEYLAELDQRGVLCTRCGRYAKLPEEPHCNECQHQDDAREAGAECDR